MQLKAIILISALFLSFDLVNASNKRPKYEEGQRESSDESISKTESLTTNDIPSSSGKRSASSLLFSSPSPNADTAGLRPVHGILKGSRPYSTMNHVHFDPTQTYNDVHDIRSLDAEKNYFEALYKNKLGVTHAMRKQGLMLSGSNICFSYVNSILRSERRDFIFYLLKNQPHVFYQTYNCGHNVFHGATQENIDFVIERTTHTSGARTLIFKEVLRNPDLSLDDDFFIYNRPDRAIEMIELAEASGRPDIIEKCYNLPESLLYFDLNGETIFSKAVLNRNLGRIKFLVSRPDAIELILMENPASGKNCIDLAIEIYDKNLDPNYSVTLNLFPVVLYAFQHGKTETMEELLEQFIDNIVEADNNEVLLTGLENTLTMAKESVSVDDEEDEEENSKHAFIELLNQKLVEIYEFKLNEESSELASESGNESDSDSATGDEGSILSEPLVLRFKNLRQ